MLDLAGLKRLTAQDPTALRTLLEELLRSLMEDLQSLRKLSSGANASALGTLAHRIKGPARIVGAQRVIAACESVERGTTPAQLQELQRAMEELIGCTEKALRCATR